MNAAAQQVVESLKAPHSASREARDLAEAFRKHRCELDGHATIVRWARAWWRYDGVRYVPLDDEGLDRMGVNFMNVVTWTFREKKTKDGGGGELKTERVGCSMRLVTDMSRALRDVVPWLEGGAPQWTEPKPKDPNPLHLVACQNGLLDLRERKLVAPTPRFFSTQCLGAPWVPDAPSPDNWLAFLDSVWPDDPESIRALRQIMGYLVSSDTDQHKLFAMIGPPRSGKGTIGHIIKTLVGSDSVVGPTLASLERPFGLAPLVGKSIAIIGDARLGGRTEQATVVERLLSISGEDPINIDRKNKDTIDVQLRTRVLLLSNELPKLYDTSGALSARFLILQTTRSFLGVEDHGLKARIEPELPGILRWAVEGYHDLLEMGRFLMPKASRDVQADLEAVSRPITVFIEERCTVGLEARIKCADLYALWKDWCEKNGQHVSTAQSFGRDLKTALPQIKSSSCWWTGDGNHKSYTGVGKSSPTSPT